MTYVAPAGNISVELALPKPDRIARKVPVEKSIVSIRGVGVVKALHMMTGIKRSRSTRINIKVRAIPVVKDSE